MPFIERHGGRYLTKAPISDVRIDEEFQRDNGLVVFTWSFVEIDLNRRGCLEAKLSSPSRFFGSDPERKVAVIRRPARDSVR